MLDAHLILFLSLVPLAAWASQTCKCFPGDPCYPTQLKWDAFSASLSRPLLAQRPAAAPCYQSSPAFDAAACALANSDATNVTALSGLSNTLQWKNFEFLINDTTVQDCPFNPTPNATCFQGRVPVYSVQVGTVEDIQATMRFASEYNLRLVVKNTGHEQLGRPFGVGALELYMHDVDALKFSETFVPQGAPPGTAAQPAFTVGPGVGWKDVYAQANLQNYTVVGGFSVNGTVGAGGGWALGGGHSVLGSSYGMGVDNILQFTVVLPNASHVTANEFVNTQLFWALRGGGGPSFGVITSLTYRTHPNPAYTGGFFTATANSTSAYQSLIQLWLENHNAVADGGWGGPWPLLGSELAITLITPGSPPSNPTALLSLQKFFNASRTLAGVNVTEADVFPYASFEEFAHDNLGIETLHHGIDFASDAFNFAGSHTFTTSWLLPRDLTTPSNASMLAEIFSKLPGATPFLVAGGAVSKIASDATAITPAWRTALTDFTINTIWEPTQEPAEIQRVAQTLHDSITPLRQLAPIPAGGQYLNEADWLQDDWQAAQWGSNYARLLEIKREIDPHDLLIVRHGVNSEGWDDEIICKTL